jgi:hypothetical protein
VATVARERKSEVLDQPTCEIVGKDALDYFMRNTPGRINKVQKSARSQAVELLLAVLGGLRNVLGQKLSGEARRKLEFRNAEEFGVWFFYLDGRGGQRPPVRGEWNPIGVIFDRQIAFLETGKLREGKEGSLPHVDIFTLTNAYFLESQGRTYRQIGKDLGISVGQARDYCLRVHELLHGTEAVVPKNKRERLGVDALACKDCRYSLAEASSGTICTLFNFHVKPDENPDEKPNDRPKSFWIKLTDTECYPAWNVADESRKYGCPDLDRHLNAVTLPLCETLSPQSDLRGPANERKLYRPQGHSISVKRGREELESHLSSKWLPGQT